MDLFADCEEDLARWESEGGAIPSGGPDNGPLAVGLGVYPFSGQCQVSTP